MPRAITLSPELTPGTYGLRVNAPMLLTSTRDDVVVNSGETAVVNFSLSSLIAQGQNYVEATRVADYMQRATNPARPRPPSSPTIPLDAGAAVSPDEE